MRKLILGFSSLLYACATGSDLGDLGDDEGAGAAPTSSATTGTSGGDASSTGDISGPGGTSSSGPGAGGASAAGGAGGSGTGGEATSSSTASSSSSSSSSSAASSSAAMSSSSGGCVPVDLLVGGGFEAGMGGGDWVESSTSFGTPICDAATCGLGGGTGPYAGTYWAWFGGTNVAPEQATVSQTVVIPPGMATLDFQLEIPSCEDPAFASDSFQVLIDGNVVFQTGNQDPSCFVVGYQTKSVDVTSYADGGNHTIAITGTTDDFVEVTNFMVDDVQLIGCQ